MSRRSPFGILARGIVFTGLALACVFAGLRSYAVAPPVLDADARPRHRRQKLRAHLRTVERHRAGVVASVVASEDARFCENGGVDWGALHEVLYRAGKDGPSRGASTITMQTAKNLFLGLAGRHSRVEIAMALVIGKVWTKARTMEVYLNIAEWGDGAVRHRGGGAALLPQKREPARCARGSASGDVLAESDQARRRPSGRVSAPPRSQYCGARRGWRGAA